MRKSRFTEAQIIGMIKEQEAGMPTAEVCRKHGLSQGTFYKFKSKYGGMEVSDARAAATGIEADVLDLVAPEPKQEARALAAQLHRGAIFEKGVLAMLYDLIGVLDAEIAEGTYMETRFDHSPENVSDYTTWGQERLTPEAVPGLKEQDAATSILSGLKTRLMQDEAYAEFRARFLARTKVEEKEREQMLRLHDQSMRQLESRHASLMKAIGDGDYPPPVIAQLNKVDAELGESRVKRER